MRVGNRHLAAKISAMQEAARDYPDELSVMELTNCSSTLSPAITVPSTIEDNQISRPSIKSGHAKTHAIVINLDDKTRFTEEVTV